MPSIWCGLVIMGPGRTALTRALEPKICRKDLEGGGYRLQIAHQLPQLQATSQSLVQSPEVLTRMSGPKPSSSQLLRCWKASWNISPPRFNSPSQCYSPVFISAFYLRFNSLQKEDLPPCISQWTGLTWTRAYVTGSSLLTAWLSS